MEIKKLSENLSVAGQLIPADVANIAELGFKTIICNRPDGEASDQPEFDTIRHNAEKCRTVCGFYASAIERTNPAKHW